MSTVEYILRRVSIFIYFSLLFSSPIVSGENWPVCGCGGGGCGAASGLCRNGCVVR